MNFRSWFTDRGPIVILQRGFSLLRRYGLGAQKASHRVSHCAEVLRMAGCSPTFPTPGIIVERHPEIIRALQAGGAEIAVHSYQHVDLTAMSVERARAQIDKAVDVFKKEGIEGVGFRGPYMRSQEDLLNSLPDGMFLYSSNQTICWNVENLCSCIHRKNQFFDTLDRLYRPRSSEDAVCLPWMRRGMVEIPACIPDDIQLHDALSMKKEQVAEVWGQLTEDIYKRGELFTVLFHPELASYDELSFANLLQRAKEHNPHIWVARLREIAEWWLEKAAFTAVVTEEDLGLRIRLNCSDRATVLLKGYPGNRYGRKWFKDYQLVKDRDLVLPAFPRPFVGIETGAPDWVTRWLKNEGYLVEQGEKAAQCGVFLDEAAFQGIDNELKLVECIERAPKPLLRFWRWPDGARSALSISGDLDALSLSDYLSRLFVE